MAMMAWRSPGGHAARLEHQQRGRVGHAHYVCDVRGRWPVRIHAAAHLPAASRRSQYVLGIGGGHRQRVSAAAPARLGHAPVDALPSWSSCGNGIRVNDNTGSVFDYLDPQWQYVVNAGWNKGVHNVKFGFDLHRLHMNHYENHRAELHLQRRRHGAQRDGRCGTDVHEQLQRDFLLGLPFTRNSAAEPAADRGRRREQRAVGDAPLVEMRPLHSRPVPADAQSPGIGRRALECPVPQHVDRGIEVFDFTTNRLMMCGLGSNPIDCGRQGAEGSLHATPRRRLPGGESMVFRAGCSRNPQNDNMIGTRMRNFPVNVQINDVAVEQQFHPVGSFSDSRCCRFSTSTSRARGASRREHHDQRSRQLLRAASSQPSTMVKVLPTA